MLTMQKAIIGQVSGTSQNSRILRNTDQCWCSSITLCLRTSDQHDANCFCFVFVFVFCCCCFVFCLFVCLFFFHFLPEETGSKTFSRRNLFFRKVFKPCPSITVLVKRLLFLHSCIPKVNFAFLHSVLHFFSETYGAVSKSQGYLQALWKRNNKRICKY